MVGLVGDRERGAVLIALALGMLVVTLVGGDGLDSWSTRVELGLVAVGVLVGLGLVFFGRSR